MWTAAILAGGRARRLGGLDKASLMLGARSMRERQLAVLREVARHLLVVGDPVTDRWPADAVHVPDRSPNAGPMGGVLVALQACPTERLVLVACDLPFLNVPFLRYLQDAGANVDVAMPRTGAGYQPLCATYARRCAGWLDHRIAVGALTMRDIMQAPGLSRREIGVAEIAPFDPAGTLFFNVNTPEEYASAVELSAQFPSDRWP